MKRRFKLDSNCKWLFVLGLFSMTQISLGGYIAISEVLSLVATPFLFSKNMFAFRRDGILVILWLLVLWLGGALVADFCAHTPMRFMLRGIAVPIVVFSNIVCIYGALRRNPAAFKWYVIGAFLSSIISIFVFQAGSDVGSAEAQGVSAAEAVMSYKLFWIIRINSLLGLPATCWYLDVPFFAIILCKIIGLYVSISQGGRSAFAISLAGLFFLFMGRQDPVSMRRIKHRLLLVALMSLLSVVAMKEGYKYAATSGLMKEGEREKFEKQTKGGKAGILATLMAGRGEFFIGLTAALDKPFIGHGSHALDICGYEAEFVAKYGNEEDVRRQMQRTMLGVRTIPAHSHIVTFWMWHGIWGLIFWLYVICLCCMTLVKRLGVYPPWFGYLVGAIPGFIWSVLFSPFGGRMSVSMFLCVCLLLRAMEKGYVRRDYWAKGKYYPNIKS